jgi:hypothetical protein
MYVGATMYHMLTGKVPFSDTQKNNPNATAAANPQMPVTNATQSRWDYLSIIHAHLARTPPDVARSRKDLHPVIPQIVAKLMQKNPRQRSCLASPLPFALYSQYNIGIKALVVSNMISYAV